MAAKASARPYRILLVEDSPTDAELCQRELRKGGLKFISQCVDSREGFERALEVFSPELILSDFSMPTGFDGLAALGQRQENAGLLRKAGVQVALIGNAGGGDEEAFNVRNIKQEAGNAVSYGMTWDDALRAVTLTPAEVFGASDRVGALKPGLEGNVVVWSGDPFEFTTRAEHVFVRGREYTDKTRQDLLVERYRSLPSSHNTPPLQ